MGAQAPPPKSLGSTKQGSSNRSSPSCIVTVLISLLIGFQAGRISTQGGLDKIDTNVVKAPFTNSSEQGSDKPSDNLDDYLWNGEEIYLQTAKALSPVTDKVTAHSYQVMYGRFLLPYYHQLPEMKMLEIGLGCDMRYGPGASVALHQKLFPRAEFWEAEYDKDCVEEHADKLKGINVLTGDQGNDTVLDGWIQQAGGGNFDVVIDDGGHQNCQIWHSFNKLWPVLKPGGLYFIEDMQVALSVRYRSYKTATCNETLIVPDKLKEFIDTLMYTRKGDILFVHCQMQACVLGKKK